MSEKRRLSTRNRGEPPLKKRALSPPPPPAVAAPPPPPNEPLMEGLPVRLKEGRPLPTLSKVQDQSLPRKSHQTISERSVIYLIYIVFADSLQWRFSSLYRTVTAEMAD